MKTKINCVAFCGIGSGIALSSNEKFPKRDAVNMQRLHPSGASSDGGGRSPASDTTSPARRAASPAPAAGTASNVLQSLFYCPLRRSRLYSLCAVGCDEAALGAVHKVFGRGD